MEREMDRGDGCNRNVPPPWGGWALPLRWARSRAAAPPHREESDESGASGIWLGSPPDIPMVRCSGPLPPARDVLVWADNQSCL